MARRVKFKARGRKVDLREAFLLCINQKRHDADGNRIPGYDVEEIMAMTPADRERVRRMGWMTTKPRRSE